MKEWQRTIVLLILLGVAIGFLVWNIHQSDTNFVNRF
jgi:hypothetical protein